MDKRLVLVDGSSYLFRAYYALPPLTNSAGFPTGAVYGVLNMLKKLLQSEPSSYFAVVFDTKGPNFRHELLPSYKANRTEMPEELAKQIEPLHELIKALGLPLIAVPGVEADDVIATIASLAEKESFDVLISTGDKDLAQLVTEKVTLINTMTDQTLDVQGVIDKFGVPPEKICDYLALMGDSVDNIPGVEKVGPKTAAKWINLYGSLDGVIENQGKIKGKVGDNLRAALAQLPVNYSLVTVKKDVELPLPIDALVPGEPDTDTLKTYYETFNFKNWLKQLSEDSPQSESASTSDAVNEQTDCQYHLVLEETQFDELMATVLKADVVVLDTETTNINAMRAELVGIALAVEADNAYYIPVGHDYDGAPKQLPKEKVLSALKPVLESPTIQKVGQNLKYDWQVLAQCGIQLNGIAFDTMVASYVLNSTAHRHDMTTLAEKFLSRTPIAFEAVAGKGAKQLTFNQIDIEAAAEYAAEDAEITWALYQVLKAQIDEAPETLRQVFYDIDLPLVTVLAKMESNGVLIDSAALQAQSELLSEALETVEASAFEVAGESFNLNSPKQLQHILFEKLGIPVTEKTPKGQPSTAESVLVQLADDHALPALILRYRSLSKLKSTYTDKLQDEVNPKTQRVHASFHQAVVATGRLSSSDPNLQNIPIRTEEGRRVREAFVAPENRRIIAADYSQVELRLMAHFSQDEALINAFNQNWDIHRFTASEVFGVALDEVTSEQRRSAKAINFGLIYGISAYGLSRQLDLPVEEAKAYIDLYFSRYPDVKRYMLEVQDKAREQGFVETLSGRRLYLPDINAKQMPRRRQAERVAINAPLQGTAADIMKLAMIQLLPWLDENQAHIQLIMQVHDELVFEVDSAFEANAKAYIQSTMENAYKLSVPLVVEVGAGAHWGEAH